MAAITWINRVNVTPTGTTLTKNGGSNDTPDASAQSDAAMDGDGDFTITIPALGQIVVGLDASASVQAFAAINYCFSMHDTGYIDYRDAGAYISEGTYTAGAVLKINRTGTTIRFYVNNVLKATAPTASTGDLYAHVLIYDVGDTVSAGTLDAAAEEPPPGDPTVPHTYDLRTDRLTEVPGATPTLGAVGSRIIDAKFNTPQHRATGPNSGAAFGLPAGRSWSTNSATYQCQWNSDSTRLAVRNTNGATLILTVNPDASEALNEPLITGELCLVNTGIEGAWSKTNPNLMYMTRAIGSKAIEAWDITQSGGGTGGAPATVLDLDTIDAGLGATYLNSVYCGGGPTPRIAAAYGGTAQGNHFKVVVFSIADPSQRHVINMSNNTIDGVQAKDADGTTNFTFEGEAGFHSISISNDSRYVRIDPNWNSSNGFWLYDYTLNRITKVTTRPAGHYIMGWPGTTGMINEDQGAGSKPQWQARSLALADVETVTARITTPISPVNPTWGDHQSWHNARSAADADAPFFSDSHHYDPTGLVAWTVWSSENIAVASVGSETVWRAGHHRMIANGDINPASNPSEEYQPRANVSMCGRFLAYKTNWDKSLGYDTVNADPMASNARYRTEVMVARLARVSIEPPPVEPPPTPAPRRGVIVNCTFRRHHRQEFTFQRGRSSVNIDAYKGQKKTFRFNLEPGEEPLRLDNTIVVKARNAAGSVVATVPCVVVSERAWDLVLTSALLGSLAAAAYRYDAWITDTGVEEPLVLPSTLAVLGSVTNQ